MTHTTTLLSPHNPFFGGESEKMIYKVLFDRTPIANGAIPIKLSIPAKYEYYNTLICRDYRSISGLHWEYCNIYGEKTIKYHVTGPFNVLSKVLSITPATKTGKEGKNSTIFNDVGEFREWIEEITKNVVAKFKEKPVICQFDHDGVECWILPKTLSLSADFIGNQANLYIYRINGIAKHDIKTDPVDYINLGNHIVAPITSATTVKRRTLPRYNVTLEYAVIKPKSKIEVKHNEHGETSFDVEPTEYYLLIHFKWGFATD